VQSETADDIDALMQEPPGGMPTTPFLEQEGLVGSFTYVHPSDRRYHGITSHRPNATLDDREVALLDWPSLYDQVAVQLGTTPEELRAVYSDQPPGRPNAKLAARRAPIDAAFLRVHETGGNVTLLCQVLGFDPRDQGRRILKRARKARAIQETHARDHVPHFRLRQVPYARQRSASGRRCPLPTVPTQGQSRSQAPGWPPEGAAPEGDTAMSATVVACARGVQASSADTEVTFHTAVPAGSRVVLLSRYFGATHHTVSGDLDWQADFAFEMDPGEFLAFLGAHAPDGIPGGTVVTVAGGGASAKAVLGVYLTGLDDPTTGVETHGQSVGADFFEGWEADLTTPAPGVVLVGAIAGQNETTASLSDGFTVLDAVAASSVSVVLGAKIEAVAGAEAPSGVLSGNAFTAAISGAYAIDLTPADAPRRHAVAADNVRLYGPPFDYEAAKEIMDIRAANPHLRRRR
jgi:hypothetical protein